MNQPRSFDRVLHWVAAIGPMLFFAVATALGSLRAGYDPIAEPISALALGPQGWAQAVNFGLLAASFLAFAAVLRKHLSSGVASVAGPSLFVLMAVGVVLAALFPMDAEGAPATMSGRLHELGGFLVFPWMPIALLVVARRYRRDARWRPYFAYTLATGLFCLAAIVFFLVFVGPPGWPPRLASGLRGLVQRAMLLPFLTWITLVARLACRTAHDEAATRPGERSEALSM